MGKVYEIDPCADQKWDRFVEQHPFGWVCHLSGWKRALERSFTHIKGHCLALVNEESETYKAALPLYEVRSRITGRRLVSIPFSSLCDPLISSSDEFRPLFEASLGLAKRVEASYIEIRTRSSSTLLCDNRLGESRFYQHHYLTLQCDTKELKKRFHRTCVRQGISRALRSGLELKIAEDESAVHDFYRIHKSTRKRLGLPPQPLIFFQSIWTEFSATGNVVILFAKKNGLPIATVMLFKFNDRVSAEVLASNWEFSKLSPNHFLLWEAIKMADSEGYKVFDFGITSPNNESLMDFKSRWGTHVQELSHYYYPKQACEAYGNRENTWKYRIMRSICGKAPDYALERIGRFCYRHLG